MDQGDAEPTDWNRFRTAGWAIRTDRPIHFDSIATAHTDFPQPMKRILVTGSNGQIGSDLVRTLRRRHGTDRVVALDVEPPAIVNGAAARTEVADVRDADALARVVHEHEIGAVYHLASLLSASGERKPDRAWDVNVNGLKHVLDLAREHALRVFWPSSIAVFGPDTPKTETPQETILTPDTMYGVTKRSGELLCRYYHRRYGVDVRSVRYPGLISYLTPPGGGTTDYAVDMLQAAERGEPYTCFLRPDTRLPMMYMPDALQAIHDLMAADADALSVRTSYNVTAFSFSAEELADAIRAHCPSFTVEYAPDERQQIADSWPASIDDTTARADWDWAPSFDLDAMVADMLEHLREGVGEREHG
jgi:nucleoside-diphosphate-sugar epimerase